MLKIVIGYYDFNIKLKTIINNYYFNLKNKNKIIVINDFNFKKN